MFKGFIGEYIGLYRVFRGVPLKRFWVWGWDYMGV